MASENINLSMMNKFPIYLIFALLCSCTQQSSKNNTNAEILSAQLEELKKKSQPCLGEIMGEIQMHHAKLWFAGINTNWPLSEYQIEEIKELIEEASEIEPSSPEVKTISMIYPAIDSLEKSIHQKDLESFKSSFHLLTNTCNKCHTANRYGFIVITIPSTPPVSNQDFHKPSDELKAENSEL